MTELKQCKACGEEIKSIAKRCHHCHSWQSNWHIEPSNPFFVIIFVIIMFGVVSMMFARMGLWGIANLQDYISKVVIIESNFRFGEDKHGDFISVVGRIKNDTDIQWEDIHFEVQFYDSSNTLIDSLSDNIRYLVLNPHSETSFSVRGRPDRKKDEYCNFKVLIKKASESNKWL